MTDAKRDNNHIPVGLGVSNADNTTPLPLLIDSSTGRLLVSATGGMGASETDDAAFSVGVDAGTPAMGIFSTDTVDAGDVGVLAMDASRRLLVSIEADNAGIGGGTQYNEDTAHNTGDTGTMALAVRQDTPGNLSGTDGDYEPLQVSSGRLWTSTTVTGDALTALQLIDDIVVTDDSAFTPGTSKVAMVGAEFDDTTPDSVDEGDAGALRMSSRRELYTQIRDAAGNERGVNVDASNRMSVVADINSSAIVGPSDPTIDSYTTISINLTTGANQVLVSSAADKQIWVYGYAFTCGDADGQTVSLQDEDDTAITGVMEFSQYGGISVPPSGNFAMPVFKLATNKDLEIDITGGDLDGWLAYAIVSV